MMNQENTPRTAYRSRLKSISLTNYLKFEVNNLPTLPLTNLFEIFQHDASSDTYLYPLPHHTPREAH